MAHYRSAGSLWSAKMTDMDVRDFPVASLLLDEQNPRFSQPAHSQRESINALLADAPGKLVALAQDIAREGISPADLSFVVEEDGRFVVIEGNRRVAALKLLNNPDLVADEKLRLQFRAAAKVGTGPSHISCVVAETRAEARHWIELRHTGENGGVGIVPWTTEQRNTFNRRRGSQADVAMVYCKAVKDMFPDNADLLADVETVRRERLTTLGRLVRDPDVRSALGIEFHEDAVLFHYPADRILTAVERLFRDLAGNLSVSQLKSKSQRQAYVGSIEPDLPPRWSRLSKPSPGTSPVIRQPTPSGKPPNPTTPVRRREPQERYIFQGMRLRNMHLRTSDLLSEAQKIEIDRFPNMAAVMLRVLVDLAVADAADQMGWRRNQETLAQRVGVVLRKIDPSDQDAELIDARRHSHTDGLLAIKTMHGFVHHWNSHPTTVDIRKISAAYRPMLEKLDAYVGKHKKP